jgi:hypothetical protein
MKPISNNTMALGKHLQFPNYWPWFNIEPSMLVIECVIAEVK